MSPITMIGPEEVRRVVGLADLIQPVADAFRASSLGQTQDDIITMYPARRRRDGDVFVKTSYRRGGAHLVVKVSPWYSSHTAAGRPQGGLIALLDAATGYTVALIEDQHHLSDLRTAAAGALLVRLLAPTGARSMSIVGTGRQAYWQAVAAVRERPIDTVRVWGRSPRRAEALASRLRRDLGGPRVRTVAEVGAAVEDSSIVITATSARSPVVPASWLRRGQLVISVGSDDAVKAELEPGCLAAADLIVVDHRDTARRYGNVRRALADEAIEPERPLVELGELLLDRGGGLPLGRGLTIATLVGIGAQDLAAATVVAERWRMGRTRETDGP